MANIKDNITSQIPGYILEEYPRFVDFLEAYYEWLCQDSNPYGRIKNHMEYLDFRKSLDAYVDMMKQEYLSDVPDSVLFDKELFIKWSRQFNLARGSHASYKFLFRVLFGEQNTEIYVPKENILRTSDGNWISGESLMMVTYNSQNPNQFLYQTIFQERPIYQDIVERATAVVEQVRTKYSGRYVVTELTLTDIVGEFKTDFPVRTESGAQEWMINSFNDFDIQDPGTGYRESQRVLINNLNINCSEREAEEDGVFDTRVTSFFNIDELTVEVNSTGINDFSFDGRLVTSPSISEGDTVRVEMPAYDGYIVVDEVDENLGVSEIEILDMPIGCPQGNYTIEVDGIGSGLVGEPVPGFIKPVQGYYRGTKGQLSSNMYLQDSFYYQDYSYAIKTQQDFQSYADIVGELLHPAGFQMFGQISILNMIEILIEYVEESTFVFAPPGAPIVPKYGLGTNYSFINKTKHGLSGRLYNMSHLNTRDMEFVSGEDGYNLESVYLSMKAGDSYQYQPLKGWMQKDNLSDYYLFVPQDYVEEDESGDLYFETGYTSDRI